jgi:tetratricopeptide (TPR) repeat protein
MSHCERARKRAPTKTAALGLVLCALLAAPARAQEAIDADIRLFDTVRVEGLAEPLEGTILEGREVTAPRLKIRTKQGVISEWPRNKVLEIIDRESPESAFRSRSARIKDKGTAMEHRLLGEWALKNGMRIEAENELRLAAEVEKDPTKSLTHRERLMDLIDERLPELSGAARDATLEGILVEVGKAEAAGSASPRLLLARARVAHELGLPEVARGALEAARDGLEGKAQGAAVETPRDPGAPAPADPTPPPQRKPPGFKRDGEGLDPGPPPTREPDTGPPAQPEDKSDAELPGLTYPERDRWRQVLLLLGELEARAGNVDEASAAYERVLEAWPQERTACIGMARLCVSEGAVRQAHGLLNGAVRVFKGDGELLLLRGQVTLLLRDLDAAKLDFEAALKSQASTPESPLARDANTGVGLVLLAAGQFDLAEKALAAADVAPGHGQAKLARAVLAECRDDLTGAKALYEEAARLLAPRAGEAHYGLAFVHARATDATGLDAATTALREAVRQGFDLELALRALTDLAVRRGDAQAEARLLELHARSVATPSPDLLGRLGRAYLRQDRLDEAKALFDRGLEAAPDHAACLRGLAYHAYARDERDAARALFERLLKLDPKDAWATRGLRNLEEARTRRVWVDSFDRAGPEVKNSWRVEAPFGLKVELADGRAFLSGRQANEAEGKTRLSRTVAGEQVVKLEARLVLDRAGSAARAGLRFETPTGIGVVLFRDADGALKVTWTKSKTAPPEDPRPLGEWPGPGPHTLAIEVENPADGTIALWVDGVRRGELKLAGLGAPRGEAELSVYAQGLQLGEQVEVLVDEVRVYVRREAGAGRTGGGF